MTLIIFFGLGVPVTAFTFINFFTNTLQVALVGCAIGYMCGLVFEDDNIARGFSMFMTLIFMLVSGSLNIALNYPVVIDQLQYVSPNRYSVETFFRVLSDGQQYPTEPFKIDQQMIIEFLGFNFGINKCHIYLGALFGLFMTIGWVAIVVKNWKF